MTEKLAVIGGLDGNAHIRVELEVLDQINLHLVLWPITPFTARAHIPFLARADFFSGAVGFGLASAGCHFPGLEPPQRLLLVVARADNLG